MAKIVPTILAQTPAEYQERLDLVTQTSNRIHVDICDGSFVQRRTISLAQVHVPDGIELDVHLMVQNPHDHLSSALALKPSLIIIHAEADGDHQQCAADIQAMGVKAGIAYLQDTKPGELVGSFDHALIFTGELGSYGGVFDAHQLPKVELVKTLNPDIETSVDGGVNQANIDRVTADIAYAGSGYQELVS